MINLLEFVNACPVDLETDVLKRLFYLNGGPEIDVRRLFEFVFELKDFPFNLASKIL